MADEGKGPEEKKLKVGKGEEKEEKEIKEKEEKEDKEDKESDDKGSLQKTDSQTITASDREGQKDEQEFSFPDSLEGFKLAFNEKGQLRDTETGESFVFKVKDNNTYNQKRYEHIGELLTEYVYTLLETDGKLKRIYLPEDADEGDARTFVFASEDALTNPDRLIILMHGSGVVRAGQWARRLIINDFLDSGTQLPYIKRAMKEGYGVIVTNTNLNQDVNGRSIKENSSPDAHGQCVWDSLITKAVAKDIVIVAHSAGGVVTTHLALKNTDSFLSRVRAIAFTDSVHSLCMQGDNDRVKEFYVKNACNWVSSDEPLDTPIDHRWGKNDAPLVSAGHQKHEWTSHSAIESVFEFFGKRLTHKENEEL